MVLNQIVDNIDHEDGPVEVFIRPHKIDYRKGHRYDMVSYKDIGKNALITFQRGDQTIVVESYRSNVFNNEDKYDLLIQKDDIYIRKRHE